MRQKSSRVERSHPGPWLIPVPLRGDSRFRRRLGRSPIARVGRGSAPISNLLVPPIEATIGRRRFCTRLLVDLRHGQCRQCFVIFGGRTFMSCIASPYGSSSLAFFLLDSRVDPASRWRCGHAARLKFWRVHRADAVFTGGHKGRARNSRFVYQSWAPRYLTP